MAENTPKGFPMGQIMQVDLLSLSNSPHKQDMVKIILDYNRGIVLSFVSILTKYL